MASAILVTTKIYVTAYTVLSGDDSRFVGWYAGQATLTSENCPAPSTWSLSGNYGQCCDANARCFFGTSCQGSVMLAGAQDRSTCASSSTCQLDYVFNAFPTAMTTITNARCRYNLGSFSWYRTLTTSSVSTQDVVLTVSLSTDSSARISAGGFVQTSAVSTFASQATGSTMGIMSSPISPATPSSFSHSDGVTKSWIAAAVVAPVVVLALIIALAWWLVRRRQRNAVVTQGNEKPVMMPM